MSLRMRRRPGVAVLFSFCALGTISRSIRADPHPTGVPVLNSRPGAPYTIYLDFAGFNFNGSWGSNTGQGTAPGDTGAIDGATGTFNAAQQQIIENTWAGIAEKYSVFNGINITTVDPAPAGDSDAQRQAWYDSQPRMMHTILGDDNNWANAGGISYVGVTPYAQTVNGYHTNWVFVNGTGGDTSYHGSVAAGTHENGHGFGLNHQADYDPVTGTDVSDYSSNNNASGYGSYAPIMGVTYSAQRSLWRIGFIGNGSIQNDVQTIVNDNGMTGYVADGIGQTLATATAIPLVGSTVNFNLAKGVITPLSVASPQALGVSSYTTDCFRFTSLGGALSLTLNDGGQWLTPGVAATDPMFRGTLQVLDAAGNVVYTGTEANDTLSSTVSASLTTGVYYARVESTGNETGTYVAPSGAVVTSSFYDMGSYFLTGNGVASGNVNSYYWNGGLSANWSTISGGASNWRTASTGGSDPGAGPTTLVDVYFTVNTGATNLTTTLGGNKTVNTLNFTGSGTTAGSTSVIIAADGSVLTLQGGLTVAAGSAAQTIAVPVALGLSQTWTISNSTASPLSVTGIISGSGKSLTTTGTGKLILTNANTYSGGTTILGNAVTFSSGSLGTGSVTLLNGGLLQYASGNTQDLTNTRTFTIASGGGQVDTNTNNVTWAGSINGQAAGSLTKLGLGTLTLNGTGNPSNLFVRGGTVSLGTAAVLTTVTAPASAADNYSSIGQVAGDSGTLTMTGSASFTSAGDLNVADVSATGLLNVQGTATVAARLLAVGKFGSANGTVNQSGGSVSEADNGGAAGDWRIGGYGGAGDSAAVGTYILSGGSFNTGGTNLQVGAYGTGTFTQTGGSATIGAYLSIGRFTGGHGTWDLSTGGGTLIATAEPYAIVGEQGSGVLKVGGTASVNTNGLRVGFTGGASGIVNQTSGNITATNGVESGGGVASGGSSVGIFNLSGGVLTTASVSQQPGTGVTGTLNLNGGTLKAALTGVSLINGLTTANVQAGGAVIDSNGNSVTVDQTLQHDPALGATLDGGLTKNGSGVVAITAAATYTGTTTVNAGTLRLQSQASMPIANPIAWFDAADASTLTVSSGVVVGWANKGTAGASLNASQTVSGVGPIVSTPAATGGKTVLTFNGSTSGLVTAANIGISGSQDRTLFVVGDRGAGSIYFAHEGPIGSNNQAYGISSETGNSFLYTWGNDITFGTQPTGAYEILDSELTGSGTALSGDLIDAGVLSTSSRTVVANTTAGPLYLGDRPTNIGTGDVAEVIEYDGALTAAQRTAVEAYLNFKWFGISASVSNLLPTATAMNLNASGATLDLNGINQTVGSLAGVAGSSITLGGATLATGNATSTAFAGQISGAGNLTLRGTGIFTISGINSYTGVTTINAGATMTVTNTGKLPAGTLSVAGTLFLQPATAGGILVRREGAITINAGGKINLPAAAVHTNRTLLSASSLTLAGAANAWTGTLDLASNDLDITAGNLANITNQVKSGYNFGAWSGSGITSSTAAADTQHLTAIGILLNNDGSSNPLYGAGALGSFDGVSPALNDVLVKYTYYGDANLDGHVDGSDYARIDNGFLTHATGWYNGDFNYDTVIDGSDYTLMDNAFNMQGAQISSQLANPTAQLFGSGSAVPEPATLSLLGIAATALLGRRSCRNFSHVCAAKPKEQNQFK